MAGAQTPALGAVEHGALSVIELHPTGPLSSGPGRRGRDPQSSASQAGAFDSPPWVVGLASKPRASTRPSILSAGGGERLRTAVAGCQGVGRMAHPAPSTIAARCGVHLDRRTVGGTTGAALTRVTIDGQRTVVERLDREHPSGTWRGCNTEAVFAVLQRISRGETHGQVIPAFLTAGAGRQTRPRRAGRLGQGGRQ
jgi:hypothetical protein